MTQTPSSFADTLPVDVAYGVDRPPGAAQGTDHSPRIRLMTGEKLRLNSESFVLPPPAIGQDKTPLDTRLAEHLKRLSGVWNKPASTFIDAYFAYLHGQIGRHRNEIAERLSRFAGLFRPEDALYGAPLPLPRAYLPLTGQGAGEWVSVDVLFWDGVQASAVLFTPSKLLPGAEKRRRERLAAAGIGASVLSAADLAKPDMMSNLLGSAGETFWRDEVLPVAPGSVRLPDF